MRFALYLVGLVFGLSQAAAEDGFVIVTVGEEGHRMSSRDGVRFSVSQPNENSDGDLLDLFCVCHGNGVFVAVGGWRSPQVFLAGDGETWEEVDPAEFEGVRGPASRVVFAEGHFFLMSQSGSLLRSSDGRNWEHVGTAPLEEEPKRQRLRDLAYGNGVFVGTGSYGALAVSRDMGKTWTVLTVPLHGSEPVWPSVVFGNGIFIIAGESGYTATSRDGVIWENETTHDGRYRRLSHVSWTGREFFAHGEPADDGPPFRLMSRDGTLWTSYQPGRKNQPNRIWRFGSAYFGISENRSTGESRLFRSQNTREWELLDKPQGVSVRWMASNLAIPETSGPVGTKLQLNW